MPFQPLAAEAAVSSSRGWHEGPLPSEALSCRTRRQEPPAKRLGCSWCSRRPPPQTCLQGQPVTWGGLVCDPPPAPLPNTGAASGGRGCWCWTTLQTAAVLEQAAGHLLPNFFLEMGPVIRPVGLHRISPVHLTTKLRLQRFNLIIWPVGLAG